MRLGCDGLRTMSLPPGFANFGSIAMQIAGMGELAPSKRSLLAQLGPRALLGGALASLMTATVAGVLVAG